MKYWSFLIEALRSESIDVLYEDARFVFLDFSNLGLLLLNGSSE